jgi:hypothetical protein
VLAGASADRGEREDVLADDGAVVHRLGGYLALWRSDPLTGRGLMTCSR